MNPNLFSSAEFYKRRYQNFSSLLIVPLFLFTCLLLVSSFIFKKEITLKSTGELTPTQAVTAIQSLSNHPIRFNHLKQNKGIKKGDTLLEYEDMGTSWNTHFLDEELGTLTS